MSTYRTAIRFICIIFGLALPITALAGNFEVKALIDTDNSRSTGCTIITPGGIVTGIDAVLTTAGTVSGTTGSVTAVTRQTCSGGSLGLPTAVDGGWNVGVSATGDLFIESHYGRDLITMDNIGTPRFVFTASSGTLSDVILTPYSWGGGDVVMLHAARDRAVASTPPRAITLDGDSSDWAGVVPLGNGTETTPAWRFISASAYAGSHDLFFAYSIHTNPGAPTAIDDHYALSTLGGTLTVATLGVQNNDIPNFQPVTSVKIDNPQHGSVTLAGDGGFTYVHDGSLANQDLFHYVLNGTTLQSNIATVIIDLPGNRPYAFTSANNTTFVVGQFNSFTVTVTGKPTPALTEEGGLPAGVSFTDNGDGTGTLSGTPGPNTSGSYDIVFFADKNKPHHISQNFTLTVVCPGITITNPAVSSGTAGTAFSQNFTQSGGQAPITFALNSGTLPTGMSLSTAGVLSGTPTQSGTFPITVKLTDNAGCMAVGPTYNLVITCHTVTVTNPATSTGTANAAFSQTFTQSGAVSGATFTINTGSLPSGLALSTAGVLSGTPTQTGSFPITVKVTDGQGCVGIGSTYNLVINCQTITVTNPATNNAAINVAFSQTFTASNTIGVVNFTLNSGTLPNGLTLSAGGVLSGSPTQTGSFPITVKATDANGCFAVGGTYTLTVFAPPVANADSYIVTSVAAPGVLGNDTTNGAPIVSYGINGNEQATIGSSTPTSQGGTVVLNADGSLTYTPAGGFTGTDTFKYKLTNFAGSSTATVSMRVNVAPVNTVPGAQSTNEDTPLVFSSLSISDADAGTNNVQVTLTVTNGIVTLSGTSGLSVTGNGTNTVTVQGTIANINAALNGMSFTPSLNYNGGASLQIVTNDLGNTGSGGPKSDTDSVAITVNAVNDPPVNTVPGTQTINEDTTLTFTGATAITISDVDAGGANVTVTLSSANGTITLGSTAGLTTVTGNGTGTVAATGPIATINTDLNNTVFTPTANFNGSTAVGVSTNDLGNTGAGGAQTTNSSITVNVTAVNDAPVITRPATALTNEDTPFTFSGGNVISIADVDAGAGSETITLSVTSGTLTLSGTTGLTVSGNGTNSITASGTLTNLNNALNGLVYASTLNYNGSDTLNIGVNDNGNSGTGGPLTDSKSVAITITAVNDPPVLTAGATLAYTENNPATAVDTTVTVNDVDNVNLASATVQITGNYVNGQDVLSFTNTPPITGVFTPATGTLALSGSDTLANYQTALRNVKYANTSDNPSTAARTVTWIGNDGSASSTPKTSTINVTAVNDAPVLANTSNVTYTENDPPLAIDPAITVSDVDSANMSNAAVQFGNNYFIGEDVLTFTNTPTITGTFNPSTAILSLTGVDTVANYQAALRNVKYVNTSENPTAISKQIVFAIQDDFFASASSIISILNVVAVNDPPVVTAGGTLNYTENAPATAIDTGLTVTDVDNANLTGATVTISNNFNNTQDVLAFANIGAIHFVSYTGGVLTITGTDSVANYQAALRTVTYQNTSDNPTTADRTITWIVNDGTDPSVAKTSTVKVTAVNDAPVAVNDGPGGSYQVLSGAAVTVNAPGVLANDTDAELSALTVSSVTGTGAAQPVGVSSGTATTAHGSVTMFADGHFTYTNNGDSATSDSFTYTANDGALDSNNATVTITIVHDQPPVITAGGTLNYTENQVATAIDNTITVSDADNANMASATVQLTTNYVNGQDILGFTTQNGITGNFVAATGTLTLTGSSSKANYQTALRSVTYFNNSDNPSGLARTVVWTVNDGLVDSNTATSTINVTPVNDPPVVTAGGTLNYTENQVATVIDNTITVSDLDNANMASATVQLTTNYVNGQDILGFTTQNGITGVFTAATGTMALTGSSSVANYQAALRSVTYFNNSDNPSGLARTVVWTVNDGTANSNQPASTINVTPVNDAPVLTAGGILNYTENQVATAIDNTVTVSDLDNANMASATIQLTTNYVNGQDILGFTTQNGITGVFTAATGTMALTGSSSVANYQTALRSVTYFNNSDNPSGLARTVVWTVNDGSANSNQPTSTINVTPVNDAPVLVAGNTLAYTENQAATAASPALTLTDVDSANITGATVQITGNYLSSEDVLSFATISPISGSFVTGTGTLTLTGTDTVANYQAALRTVKYNNTSESPSTLNRTLTWNATDGALTSTNATSTITVASVDDPPTITSANTANVPENTISVLTVTSTDPDGNAPHYTITGGADSSKFSIGLTTGVLTFQSAPNFEAPTDSNGDNVYVVQVTADDQLGGTTNQTISVTVTNVDEPPAFTSTATPSVPENTTAVVTVTAPDPEGTTVKYTLTGGADQAKFSLDTNTGALAFITPPNFEAPTDAGANNVYDVQVTATDNNGTGLASVQNIAVTVTNVNEAPSFTSTNTNSIPENTTAAKTVTASDPDTVPAFNTLTYSIVAGADSAKFSIGSSSGLLTFNSAPDFENPTDVGGTPGDNIYVVTVQVSDGTNSVQQTISITVTNVNEPPTASADTYTALANTTMVIGAGVSLPGTTVASTGDVTTVARTTGVIGNDTDPDSVASGFANLSVSTYTGNAGSVAAGVATTTTHGTLTVASDGSILYTPTAGNTLDDTFTYNLTDGTNTVGPATVTIHIATPRIWYVKNDTSTAGTAGTSADPFKTVAALNGTTFAASDIIYIMTGTLTGGTRLTVPAPITLNQNSMKIWGQGVALSLTVNTHVLNLISAGTAPNIGSVTGSNVNTIAITNATGTEVKGLDVQAGANGTSNAISVTSTATNSVGATVANTTVSGATGIGIALTAGGSGTSTIDVQSIPITSTGDGFNATRTAGTMSIVFSNNTVTSGANGVNISGGAIASSTITAFSGNTITGNTAGSGILASNVTFDTTGGGGFTPVSGGNTVIGSAGNGVGASGLVLTTVAGDLSFTDLDIVTSNGAGLSASSALAFTNDAAGTGFQISVGAGVATIDATGGPAVNLSTVTGTLPFVTIKSTSSATTGVALNSFLGSFSAGSGSTISGVTSAAGTSFQVGSSNATITYDGTIANTIGKGIDLTNNNGSVISFTGQLTLSSTTNNAFSATGAGPAATTGGTVTATNANNTLTTTTGTALNVVNTTIGAGGLIFKSISANGGANGIFLNNTGSTAGLSVNGDGANTSVGGNSTGGTISNMVGADGTTSGTGIYLNSTKSVVLRRMLINGTNQNYGIKGFTVNGFTLEYSTVTGTNGTSASADTYGDGSVFFGNASTAGINTSGTFTNNVINGGRARNLSIVNGATGSVASTTLTVKGCTFGAMLNFSDGNQSVAVENRASGTTLNTVFGGPAAGEANIINNSVSDSANFTGQTGTTMDVQFKNNTLSNNNANNIIGGGSLNLSDQGIMTFDVDSNAMRDANGSAVTLFKASSGTSLTGRFTNNTIGVAAVTDSGSKTGNGIFVSAAGTGTMGFTITGNQIHQIHGNSHIWADNTGGSYTANFTIQNNLLDTPGAGWFAGMAITNGANLSSDTVNVCATIGGSTAGLKNTLNVAGGLGIIVGSSGANGGHTFNLPGYAGGANFTNVQNFIQANNAGSFTTQAYADAPATAAAFTGSGSSCPTP